MHETVDPFVDVQQHSAGQEYDWQVGEDGLLALGFERVCVLPGVAVHSDKTPGEKNRTTYAAGQVEMCVKMAKQVWDLPRSERFRNISIAGMTLSELQTSLVALTVMKVTKRIVRAQSTARNRLDK